MTKDEFIERLGVIGEHKAAQKMAAISEQLVIVCGLFIQSEFPGLSPEEIKVEAAKLAQHLRD